MKIQLLPVWKTFGTGYASLRIQAPGGPGKKGLSLKLKFEERMMFMENYVSPAEILIILVRM